MVEEKENIIVETGNKLFPVFLKLETLRLLIIGGGYVALEKLQAVLQNSPSTPIHLVGISVQDKIYELSGQFTNITIDERPYSKSDIEQANIVIAAVNDIITSEHIRNNAHSAGKLVNVADKPELCDFYLSSVVKKGNLKIAISTNGTSPTIAKRLKEQINEMMPDEIEGVLQNMQVIRNGMNGDFAAKVRNLNEITAVLAAKQIVLEDTPKSPTKQWQKIVGWCLLAFFFMVLGHEILSYIPFNDILNNIKAIPHYINTKTFLIMFCTGFIAQMVDGSLGMGYGTISTTFLLANGVSPAIVSSRVHSARVFSSGVSGYSHHRFGNINKKLFRSLVIPGIIGAVIGASFAFFAQRYSSYIRIPLSVYTLYLGFFILQKAFKKKQDISKIKSAGWLATIGGFMDSFAGGGWGTLVTSTLISKRKSPRYVIGSVCLAEFFVVLCSSITFFILLKSLPVLDIAGLIIGGLLAAPIAARLVGKVPVKKMFIAIGILVILTSCMTLWRVIAQLIH
ncbi:MAG: TSUP family transporter [Ginsengibacter sp.]